MAESGPDGVRVDVPVVLVRADVVFNLDHPAFSGEKAVGLVQLRRMLDHFEEHRTEGRIVAVLHGQMGHLALADEAYDRIRKTTGGNPYRAALEELASRGVALELCANTVRGNGWTSRDLLPAFRVTTAAILRLVELLRAGFVQIHP